MSGKNKIHFFFNEVKASIPGRTELKNHIASIFKKEEVKLVGLSYVFCTDKFLLDINKKYLDHDDYTDIITFDLSSDEGVQGEIYISLDRIKDNAKKFKRSFREEVSRVIFHGALHLCGYKDKSEKDKKQMREKETFYLLKAGFNVSREKVS